MSEILMTTEVEADDFTDELSDEALDRPEGATMTSASAPSACALRLTLLRPPASCGGRAGSSSSAF